MWGEGGCCEGGEGGRGCGEDGGSGEVKGGGSGSKRGEDVVKGTVLTGVNMDKQPVAKRLVRMYRSRDEDLKWAQSGLVGTVISGEPIPLIENRVEDGGFKDLDIIPIGANKVFIHSLSVANMTDIVGNRKEFLI